MAPVLSTVIESDCLNFTAVKLYDTCVVVDAHALYGELRRRQRSTKGYGVGPFHMAALFKHAVTMFLKCNIQPIFLFQGLYKRIVGQSFNSDFLVDRVVGKI